MNLFFKAALLTALVTGLLAAAAQGQVFSLQDNDVLFEAPTGKQVMYVQVALSGNVDSVELYAGLPPSWVLFVTNPNGPLGTWIAQALTFEQGTGIGQGQQYFTVYGCGYSIVDACFAGRSLTSVCYEDGTCNGCWDGAFVFDGHAPDCSTGSLPIGGKTWSTVKRLYR